MEEFNLNDFINLKLLVERKITDLSFNIHNCEVFIENNELNSERLNAFKSCIAEYEDSINEYKTLLLKVEKMWRGYNIEV